MLFSPTTHAVLLALGLLSTPLIGLTFRRRRALLTPLLFVVPVCLGLSGGDAAIGLLARVWPARAMDGEAGDWAFFAVAAFLCFCLAELVTQRVITALAGGGARFTTREEAAAKG